MTTPRFSPRRVALISFTILFLEMAGIRWLNASIHVLGYFNNLILISCFFGLGLGSLLAARKTEYIKYAVPAFFVLVLMVVFLQTFGLNLTYEGDVNFSVVLAENDEIILPVPLSAFLGFFGNVAFFVVLGQELGKQLNAVDDPLKAYGWDIAGSLLGVLAFAGMSFLHTAPHVWYIAGLLLLLVFVQHDRKWLIAGLVFAVASLAVMMGTYEDAEWSPYYKVEFVELQDEENRGHGYTIKVDNTRIQDALNMRPELMQTSLWPWVPYYQFAYHFMKPEKVLLLGAGAGNEVVMAQLQGAKEIHAVEIDPVIASYGRTKHPNTPYLYDNARVFVDDARAFVGETDEKYDLVVISALDSHKQVAGMSSMRLESFVYTVESYRKMKELVKPGGMFVLNFISMRDYMGQRTFWSLKEAWGEAPRVFETPESPFMSIAFAYGPEEAFERDLLPKSMPVREIPAAEYATTKKEDVILATDDWPHLYLEGRKLPPLYVWVLLLLLTASTALTIRVEPSLRRPNLHFFFLGAGFMLLETRSVTQMALLFGSTWNVNSLVFASILVTILIANQVVRMNKAPSTMLNYGLLVATLAIGFFFPFEALLSLPGPVRALASGVVVGLPILWASFIFSQSFAMETDGVSRAFGSNLMGVVFGGCIEYSSMILGLDSLYFVALALYIASAATMPKQGAPVAAGV